MPSGRGGNMGNSSNRGGNFRAGGRQGGNSGNQGRNTGYGGDDINYFQRLKQDLAFGIDQLQNQLNALQTAYDSLEQADTGSGDQNIGSGGMGASRGNQNDQEVGINTGNRGNQNFADSNDDTDGRTLAGRTHDAEEYSTSDLNQFLRDGARSTIDGSYDLRTKEGRALEAAGWLDNQGFPIKGRGRMFINNEVAGR